MSADGIKISLLSSKTVKLLSRLDDCFKKYNIILPTNSCVQSVESKLLKNQITWIIKRSDIEKIEFGKCFKSICVEVDFQNISKLWLEIYPTKDASEIVDLHVCFNNKLENTAIQCDIVIMNNIKHIVWEDTFLEKANNLTQNKKIQFLGSFIGFEKTQDDGCHENLYIQCSIKLISNTYKHTILPTKQNYTVNETPKIDNYLKDIFEKGIFSDVVLKVGSSNIESHKCILALKSPSLRLLLKLNHGDEQELRNENSDIIKDVLKFMYTENIKILNFKHAWKLYISAQKYDIQNLKDICSAYLNVNLTGKNVSRIFDLSREREDEYLLQACLAFIKDNKIEDSTKLFLNGSK